MFEVAGLIIFFYTLNSFIKTQSISALVLMTTSIIFFAIKYFRLKWQSERKIKSCSSSLNKQKDFFMETITHDFKIPLLAQLRGLELIQNGTLGTLNESQKDLVQQIEISCRYVLDMISMFSKAYMFEKNTYKLVYEKFNLINLITDCFDELSLTAKEKNITFSCNFLDDAIIEADKNEIKKVLINLLTNAINYSNQGGRIDVKLESQKNTLMLNLSGMGLIYKSKSFISDSRYTTIGHTLGMYICKKIIEFHNGKIFLSDDDNSLNSFTFVLPKKSEFIAQSTA